MDVARDYLKNKNFKAAERELNQILHGEIVKDATSIHEACILQSYALCNIHPTYSESYSIAFDSNEGNSALDLSETRLKCSLNWLAKALSVGINEGSAIQIKNVSIAYLEIGKTCILTKPDVFITLGRTIAESLEKLDNNAFPKWRAFFHSILAYAELLCAGYCGNDLVYEQLTIASLRSRENYSSIQSYMKIFSIIAKKVTSFSAKWDENPLTKSIVSFLQGKHAEIDKIDQLVVSGQLERIQLPVYVDSTWLGLELLKEYLVKEDYQKAVVLFEKLRHQYQNGTFDCWIKFFEEALLISGTCSKDIQSILKSLESMAKMIMNASIEGNHDFVISAATILWNLTFPKLKESPQRIEVIRIFETIFKSLCKSSGDAGQLKGYYEAEISKYYGVLTSTVSNHEDKSLTNASYSLNIVTSMAVAKALIILSDSIRMIEPAFKFETFEYRLQKLKKQELVFPQAKIMLLIDISRHCFKLLTKKSLKEDEKSRLEDLLVFSNDLLLNSNAIESASSVGINLETIFEILMIQCDGIVRRALSLFKKEKNGFLDKTMEYGLDVCQKALLVSVKAGHFWMSHNAIAQFWRFFCELFQSFPSEQWNEPIRKMYENVIPREEANDTLKTLVTIMYVHSQLEIHGATVSKAAVANAKGANASSSPNLKNAEEALKILTNLKDDNLGTIILIVPCWIKLHQLKTSTSAPIPLLEFDDPVLKLISNFEINLKDQNPPKSTNNNLNVGESIETMFSSIKASITIPANFQVRMCLKLAKLASDNEIFDFSIGIYSKIFDLLDSLEFRANSEGLDGIPETTSWILNARFDAVNRYIMDLSAGDKICNLNLLQYLVDNYRKQCVQDLISPEILQGTIKCIWNFSTTFINKKFGSGIIELVTKFLARTVKTVMKDETKKSFSGAIGTLESEILLDLIMICVDYNVNLGNTKLAVEILDSTAHIITTSSKLITMKSKLLQHISKRRLLDYKSCLMFARVLKSPIERETIFKQAIALVKEPHVSPQERRQFVIELLSQGFFVADLGEFMTDDVTADDDCQYVIAMITYETRMAELILSLHERRPQLEKLKKLVLFYISLMLKEAERLRGEQQAAMAAEKPAGKGDAKKGNNELATQNLDFSLPVKWDNNYQWPKTFKAALSQSKVMAKNPLQFLEDIQNIIKMNVYSNQLVECFPYLNLADALAESWFEKKIIFKISMSLNHAIFLKRNSGGPFEAKAHLAFAELDEKFDEIMINIRDNEDLSQSRYQILLADSLIELGDFFRANAILANLKNVAKFQTNQQIEGQCLLRIAKIQLLSHGSSESHVKRLLGRCMDLLEHSSSTDYMDAFTLLSKLQPDSAVLKIGDILNMEFKPHFQHMQLEADWLNLLVDLGLAAEIPNQQLYSILCRLHKNCSFRYDFREWHISVKKYLQNLAIKSSPFPLENVNSINDAISEAHLDAEASLEIRLLILLINVLDSVFKSLNQEDVQTTLAEVNPVDKYLADTDPYGEKDNSAEPKILETVDSLLQKLVDHSTDGHWITVFSLGMLNYIKWKKTQDDSFKDSATSNLSKLVEDYKVDKRYSIAALESLLHLLQGDDSRIKYLFSLQDCRFTQIKAKVLSRKNISQSSSNTPLKYQEKQADEQSHNLVTKYFSPSLPKNTIFLLLQYSMDEKFIFGGLLYPDFEKKMGMITSQVDVSTNDHTLNVELCSTKLLGAIDYLAKESDQPSKTHLVLCLDTKLMHLDLESWFHQRLQGVKSISIEFSLNNFLSKMDQVLQSQETGDGKKKEEKKEKKKDKDKEEKKLVELDPEILTAPNFGAIIRCSSLRSCSVAREALEKVLKVKEKILIAEDYSVEELKDVLNNDLVLFLLDKMIDVESLPNLTGKIIIALYYSFGDSNSIAMAKAALELTSLGAYACILVKGAMLNENEMIEEAVEILLKASEGQGYIDTFRRGTRWYGPRFQFLPSSETS